MLRHRTILMVTSYRTYGISVTDRLAEDEQATHAYAVPGSYNVTLHVTDDQGAMSSASGVIKVLPTDSLDASRLVITPTEGVIAPGATQVFEVKYRTTDLVDGLYEGRIDIASNAGFLNVPGSVRCQRDLCFERR